MIRLRKHLVVFLSLLTLSVWQFTPAFAETPLNKTVSDLLGSPYKYAGATPKGFDCSGFTMYVFHTIGIDLPHTSKGQALEGQKVEKANLRTGDLVFFNTGGSGISHVGIYLGDGKFVHSASNEGVVINKLSEKYYAQRYVSASRILDDAAFTKWTSEPKLASDAGADKAASPASGAQQPAQSTDDIADKSDAGAGGEAQ